MNKVKIKRAIISMISTMVLSLPAQAATQLDVLLGQIHSLQAEFTQTVAGKNQMMQQSTGSVMIAEPNQFRWQVSSPNKQLFVSDGKKVWNDEQDLNQVTVTPLNTSLSATPLLLLSGRVKDINSVFAVTELLPNSYQFKPKNPDELVQSIVLTFKQDLPSELVVTNHLGQITHIEFKHVKLNPELDPELFKFTPGPDDDVLESGLNN